MRLRWSEEDACYTPSQYFFLSNFNLLVSTRCTAYGTWCDSYILCCIHYVRRRKHILLPLANSIVQYFVKKIHCNNWQIILWRLNICMKIFVYSRVCMRITCMCVYSLVCTGKCVCICTIQILKKLGCLLKCQ